MYALEQCSTILHADYAQITLYNSTLLVMLVLIFLVQFLLVYEYH